MTLLAEPETTPADTVQRAPLTPQQEAHLDRLDRAPWRWFVSDARFRRIEDGYRVANARRYWANLSRLTTYTGPDYRVQLREGGIFIRATESQYRQAEQTGMPCRIGGAA
jgi:hypothetical protein